MTHTHPRVHTCISNTLIMWANIYIRDTHLDVHVCRTHTNTVQICVSYTLIRVFTPIKYTKNVHTCISRCNTLQHTATHCNTLQHTATYCNTLQHTAPQARIIEQTATELLMEVHVRWRIRESAPTTSTWWPWFMSKNSVTKEASQLTKPHQARQPT